MIVKTPVIGIPDYWWKKKAVKYAKRKPNLIEMDTKDLCYECYRHKEILKNFDNKDKVFEGTKYWKYYVGKKIPGARMEKIKRYKKLYDKIKEHGYSSVENKSTIIITDDGCRVDGSHRLAILLHLGIPKVMINVFSYEDVFTVKEGRTIRAENERYRKNEYPDIDR